MECKIGEIRKVGNKWLQCIESTCNKECYFYNRSLHKIIAGINGNDFGACNACFRSDNKSVIFKELEKIGGPYDDCGTILQRFKIYTNVTNADTKGLELHIYSDYSIGIEVKENKEDMKEKNDNRYDGKMDEECIPLCDALNSLPGVETTSSCCGHCKNDFMIFFNCNNSYSLAVIARAFSRRYSGTFLAWKIEVETHDNGRYDYFIHSVKPYPTELEMKTDVGQLIENLEVWKAEEYKEYFNYEGKEKQSNTGVSQEMKKKPFCLEDAKSGKPVCTRDGRKARIICFDSTLENYPLVVLVGDYPYSYTTEGKFCKDSESSSDLMMCPEKRSGYAKIRKDINLYDTKEEADRKMIGNDEYVTAKVCWEE